MGVGPGLRADDKGARNELKQNRDFLSFVIPKEWKDESDKNGKYEYLFVTTAWDTRARFIIEVRRLNAPGQGAREWAERERAAFTMHGDLTPGAVEETTIGNTRWYVLETTGSVNAKAQAEPVMITARQFFSKAPGSDTIVEIYVTANQGTFKGAFINELTAFLSSLKCETN